MLMTKKSQNINAGILKEEGILEYDNKKPSNFKRSDYIDNLKGILILWVVWWHAPHPKFVDPFFHVPAFFFLSGIFFRYHMRFKDFLVSKANRLLLPTLLFVSMGYLAKLIIYLWDHHSISGFNYASLFDIFILGHTWTTNVPVWFLLALFDIQIIFYFICRLSSSISSNPIIFRLSVLLMSLTLFICRWNLPALPHGIHSYLEFYNAFRYIFIFSVGFCFGKELLKYIENRKRAILVFLVALAIVTCYSYFDTKKTFLSYSVLGSVPL